MIRFYTFLFIMAGAIIVTMRPSFVEADERVNNTQVQETVEKATSTEQIEKIEKKETPVSSANDFIAQYRNRANLQVKKKQNFVENELRQYLQVRREERQSRLESLSEENKDDFRPGTYTSEEDSFRPGANTKEQNTSFRPGANTKEQKSSFRPGANTKEQKSSFRPGVSAKEQKSSFHPGSVKEKKPSFRPGSVKEQKPSFRPGSVKEQKPSFRPGSVKEQKPSFRPGSVKEKKPSFRPGSVKEQKPSFRPGSVKEKKPSFRLGSVKEQKPSFRPGSVKEKKPSFRPGSVKEKKPSFRPGSVKEQKPSFRPGSVKEKKPSFRPGSVKEQKPSFRPGSVKEQKPSFRPGSVKEQKPSFRPGSVKEKKPSFRPGSVKEQKPSFRPGSVKEQKPSFRPGSVKEQKPSFRPGGVVFDTPIHHAELSNMRIEGTNLVFTSKNGTVTFKTTFTNQELKRLAIAVKEWGGFALSQNYAGYEAYTFSHPMLYGTSIIKAINDLDTFTGEIYYGTTRRAPVYGKYQSQAEGYTNAIEDFGKFLRQKDVEAAQIILLEYFDLFDGNPATFMSEEVESHIENNMLVIEKNILALELLPSLQASAGYRLVTPQDIFSKEQFLNVHRAVKVFNKNNQAFSQDTQVEKSIEVAQITGLFLGYASDIDLSYLKSEIKIQNSPNKTDKPGAEQGYSKDLYRTLLTNLNKTQKQVLKKAAREVVKSMKKFPGQSYTISSLKSYQIPSLLRMIK